MARWSSLHGSGRCYRICVCLTRVFSYIYFLRTPGLVAFGHYLHILQTTAASALNTHSRPTKHRRHANDSPLHLDGKTYQRENCSRSEQEKWFIQRSRVGGIREVVRRRTLWIWRWAICNHIRRQMSLTPRHVFPFSFPVRPPSSNAWPFSHRATRILH